MIQNYLDTVGSEVTSKPRNMLLSLFKKIKIMNGGYLENRKKNFSVHIKNFSLQ